MSTDGGGWTRVWTHDGATDYDSIGLTYAVDAPELFRDATEALVAYVDGTETTGSYWASFPLPEDWRTTTPMAQPHVDTQVDARVAGRDVGRVGLHYGYANVAYGSGGCSALTWNTGTYGTVCLEDPMAPWFNGFAASLSGAPGDYCSLATGTHDATRCTTSRRFALSVR
jgi:hypothetical protein